ncbi:hypothetical protein G9464_10405 [Halostella sp. JP-L12]|uniref:hypothetical protein n=1 Tax=Halostella TaxID=1843185 RepID=UPI0013CEC14C|nr:MULTISPECIES: hypothetical protein [Halostella]NHN48007.1 hypothetical protein [Halostella sp. JP-L12]
MVESTTADVEKHANTFQELKKSFYFTSTIVSAKHGNDHALERLRQPQSIALELPGNRAEALENAAVYTRKLANLNIPTEVEHLTAVERGHRIAIHLNPGT